VGGFAAVTGGLDARRGKWLWIAIFGRRSADGSLGSFFCGGTLINSRYVLTAAHCLRPGQEGTVDVRLGDLKLANPSETASQERGVAQIIRHPDFRGNQNDIALVRLDAPVDLTEAVRPLCLPPPQQPVVANLLVEMAGWGTVGFTGDTPDHLQEVPLIVIDAAACEDSYRPVPSFNRNFPGGFQGTKVCAGSSDNEIRDACPGDSGGPLMRVLSTGDDGFPTAYELVGIVSTGVGCGNPEFPGIYTRVSSYVTWIQSQMF